MSVCKAIVKGASLPIPFPEQIGDAIAEAGQQVFAVQVGGSSEQLALARRITDFNTLVVGIDNPGDLRAAGEKVAEPLVNLRPGIGWGEHLNGEIGRAGEKFLCGGFETEADESCLGNERNVRGAAAWGWNRLPRAPR